MRQRRLSRVLVLPALLGLLTLVVGGLRAAESDDEAFTVRDVTVDATAATAAQARDNAIQTGQRQAFARLVQRLSQGQGDVKPPKVSDQDLSNLVAGFEVQEEKNSAVRYIAKLTFHFKPGPVQELLRGENVTFTAAESRPLLVVPMLRAGGKEYLWDDPNPWRVAWANLPPAEGLVPFISPIGDLNDISDLTVEQVAKEDTGRLLALAARYNAGAALVVTATLRSAGGKRRLDVTAIRYDAAQKQAFPPQTFAAQSNESDDQLCARAAQAVETDIAGRWKQENVVHSDQAEQVTVTVPIAALADWLKIQQRLAQVSFVSKATVVSLTRKEVRVTLQYVGDSEQLRRALGHNDLALSDEPGGPVLRVSEQVNAPANQ